MDKIFLSDENGKKLSYNELLRELNIAVYYYPFFKTGNFIQFWQNFLIAISRDLPITLVDSDLSESESNSLGLDNSLNKKVEINSANINSLGELIGSIKNSKSQITLFTSGTTGQPKSIRHNIPTLTRSVRHDEAHSSDVWGYAYNPTHMAGLQVFFQAVFNLNTIINLFGHKKENIYEMVNRNKVTHISATPTFYRLLLPPLFSINSVSRATFGGEKADKKLMKDINIVFPNAKIANVYASTEAGSLFLSRGDEFTIPDDIKNLVKFDHDEMLLHKKLIGESDSLILENEYYRTGDLVEWIDHAEGSFKFRSRKNELINIGGYKVNPTEVEDLLYSLPEVAGAFVFGKPNSVLGNILCADLKLFPDQILSEFDIRQFLKVHLQEYKIPRKIRFVEELSLTRTGKLKRS